MRQMSCAARDFGCSFPKNRPSSEALQDRVLAVSVHRERLQRFPGAWRGEGCDGREAEQGFTVACL